LKSGTAKYTNKIQSLNLNFVNKELSIQTHSKSLSSSDIPKISMPKIQGWGDILKWSLQENVPGEFPYTAGLFPFKREG